MFHSGCHDMKISLVSDRNVASAARDLVPTSKNLYLLQTDDALSSLCAWHAFDIWKTFCQKTI